MHHLPPPALAAALVLVLSAAGAAAQARPAPPDPMPLADYLGLLAQVAPAARDGAQAYLQAVEQRCGRALTTAQLRLAVSQGDGDPVLMGMIRAAQRQDRAAVQQLALQLVCPPGSRP